MPYYMDHPEHGAHICYTPEDVANHEKIGWLLRGPSAVASAKDAPASDDSKEALRAKLDAAGIAYDRRWGVDKLREALG